MSRHWEHLRKAAVVQGMGHGAVDLGPSIFIGLQQGLCFILQKGYCLARVEGHQTGTCLSLCHHRGRYPIGSEDEHRPVCPGQGATGSLNSPLLKVAFISKLTLLLPPWPPALQWMAMSQPIRLPLVSSWPVVLMSGLHLHTCPCSPITTFG